MFSVSTMGNGYLSRLPGKISHKSCQLAKTYGFMYGVPVTPKVNLA